MPLAFVVCQYRVISRWTEIHVEQRLIRLRPQFISTNTPHRAPNHMKGKKLSHVPVEHQGHRDNIYAIMCKLIN